MRNEKSGLVEAGADRERSVFLNVPYDSSFRSLFLAYIAGTSAFGLIPRTGLEIPGSTRRLDRILALIGSCRYSVHDMSRVQLDRRPPYATPRFNAPFELGLTAGHYALHPDGRHTWFVFESKTFRLQKSLSDLNGTDVYVHGGVCDGIFRELRNAFVRSENQPTVGQMTTIFEKLRAGLGSILSATGAASLFEASVFKELSVYASALADKIVT